MKNMLIPELRQITVWEEKTATDKDCNKFYYVKNNFFI